jgi:ATP-dependent Lon protease
MMEKKETVSNMMNLPMIPLRDAVLFPGTMMPFLVGREQSILALDAALQKDRKVFLIAQRSASILNPNPGDLYSIGTVGIVLENLREENGNRKVLVEGMVRGRLLEWQGSKDSIVPIELIADPPPQMDSSRNIQELLDLIDQYSRLVPNFSAGEMLRQKSETPGRITDIVASYFNMELEQKQTVLETIAVPDRIALVLEILRQEIKKLRIEMKLETRVKKQMEKAQREYYLNEKMKAIQKELGQNDGDTAREELEKYQKKIASMKLSKDAKEKAFQELRRLQMMPSMSAESTVSRNYLDWILGVPWNDASRENHDLKRAQEILEKDHYGLEKIKERIIEFLATRKLTKKKPGTTILCFVGPPGVGKTSLAASIARATGRKFVRLSLGGVRDEAEIRGHRRTYIGAFPGQIIQMMKRAAVMNPVFLLDEIDKMSMDFRGDPSAALLEVLDPEQNKAFLDHYLDTSYDLSRVFFIATANVPYNIPGPLCDRMEILELPGYTEEEKIQIALRFLVPKQMEAHGLAGRKIQFQGNTFKHIIRHYTREAGVRGLEREIATICRKITKKIALGETYPQIISVSEIKELLGVEKFQYQNRERKDEIGMATGLAWTETGGELLFTEATLMTGKGRLTLTGKLGKVMQESARAALSYIRSRTDDLGVSGDFYQNFDFHVHIPEGAISKDGPSAGITMATALISALTRNPVKRNVAMTGEITLRGKVLPIGGVKEKILAAHRAGVSTIILPRRNEKDLSEIPAKIRKDLQVKLVDSMDEVLPIALNRPIIGRRKGARGVLQKQKLTKRESILPQ